MWAQGEKLGRGKCVKAKSSHTTHYTHTHTHTHIHTHTHTHTPHHTHAHSEASIQKEAVLSDEDPPYSAAGCAAVSPPQTETDSHH